MSKIETPTIPDAVFEKSVDAEVPEQNGHELNLSSEEAKNQERENKQRAFEILEDIKNSPEQNKIPEPPPVNNSSSQTEQVDINGQIYTVEYVPKETIYPAFGYAGRNKATVREDLSLRVKNFVRAHELYHCQDESSFGGWIGREIRANIVTGLKDPVGLLATIKASLSKDRIKFYWERFKKGQ